ncbi:MAG: c-type cytochrome [Nannocystaceae bacterium]
MRPIALIGGYILAGLSLILLAIWIFIVVIYPRVGPPPSLDVDANPERLARGRYLVEHVTQCFACHGELQTDVPGAPVVPTSRGAAGVTWTAPDGLALPAPNISPSAVGSWSDGELARTIFLGVDPKGEALRPAMPYPHYGFMCLEDRLSVLAYLRSIPEVEGHTPRAPRSYLDSLFLRVIPREDPVPACDPELAGEDKGLYLTTIAGCSTCHTPLRAGVPDLDRAFAGGTSFATRNGAVQSTNLTPDPGTGIGRWSREDFVARFAAHRSEPPALAGAETAPVVRAGPMPWSGYAGLRDEDLAAIFTYLQTLPPIRNDAAPASSAQ